MSQTMKRRAALGLGAALAAGSALAASETVPAFAAGPERPAATAREAAERIGKVYAEQAAAAGGVWRARISVADVSGDLVTAVDSDADTVVDAQSVNKVALATAVYDRIDRSGARLDQQIELTADEVIADGDGMMRLDGAYPSRITVGHALANLLTLSCDTSVRLCGTIADADAVNTAMRAMGFPRTRVEPGSKPGRMFLGETTPREIHDLFHAHAKGGLVSEDSAKHMFSLLRSPVAFTDGIRLLLSTQDRERIATKAGWLDDDRHEAGVIFGETGAPVVVYSIFATLEGGESSDFGPRHPLVDARARMGHRFFEIAGGLRGRLDPVTTISRAAQATGAADRARRLMGSGCSRAARHIGRHRAPRVDRTAIGQCSHERLGLPPRRSAE